MQGRRIEEIRNTLCTGCSACFNICPVNAIEMKFDEKGFYKPYINDKCIDCGMCDRVCPILSSAKNENKIKKLYAMWAEDDVRLQSSSGGAFTLLAENVIKNKGVVFGAVWAEDFKVKHACATTLEELEALKKSKYLQSSIGKTYKQVECFLKEGKEVLFVGTGCQIGGLKSYIKTKNIDDKNLFTCDLYCYYTPSYGVFKKYLDHNFGPNLESFNFRLKENNIYNCSSFSYKIKNLPEQKVFGESLWFNGFFGNLYAPNHCVNCHYQNSDRYGDLSLADFWGIENHDKSWNDGKGTSMIMVNSKKGQALLKQIKSKCKRLKEVPLDWIRVGQGNVKFVHKNQQLFFDMLDNGVHFKKATNMALTDKSFDIGMACVQVYQNYGSAFTNYALYKTLKDYGKEVLIINQPMTSEIKPNTPQNFIKSPFHIHDKAKYFANKEEMKSLNKICKKFLVGSDQLFNYEIYKRIDGFVKLDWVDDNHDKVSYSTSFGINQILGSKDEQKHFGECLNRFKKVSVRESAGVPLVKENFGIDAECVMDPVFICKKEHYEELFKDVKDGIEADKVFCYILDPEKEKEQLIETVCASLGKEHYVVADMWRTQENLDTLWTLKTNLKVKNELWMANIAKSSFVVTDSFHGLCFAVIFNKPFIVLHNKNRGNARFESLLKLIGYEERLIPASTPKEKIIELANKPINFARVNEILNNEKQASIKWFEENIVK